MVDKKQIKNWLDDGTISQEQAEKMLADSSEKSSEEQSNKFLAIVATIGSILIFVGFAWLIAKNWHQIPNFIKVLILVLVTLASFVAGVISRDRNHDGVGRALITLGALLYTLSLFLISQIYNLATSTQHYAWLLFLAWTVILITAYFLDSKENILVSMLIFFPWVILQHTSSLDKSSSEQGLIIGFTILFLSIGALLYSLSVFHNTIKHKFTSMYRFWTAFCLLLIFYFLSFQSFLPLLSEYTFEANTFSGFLVFFIIICFLGFTISSLFATSKKSVSLKEILGFLGILAIVLLLVLSTKIGAGASGDCSAKSCYDFNSGTSECSSVPDSLACEWKQNTCQTISCWKYRSNETTCANAPQEACTWTNNNCQPKKTNNENNQMCRAFNNQRDNCLEYDVCKWRTSFSASRGLPTSLWLMWIFNNFVFIGFIILILWYGQRIGSTNIVNLALFAFILEIITRYIGFWADFQGYFAFSMLAIIGGLLLIFGAWRFPKWRREMLAKTEIPENQQEIK